MKATSSIYFVSSVNYPLTRTGQLSRDCGILVTSCKKVRYWSMETKSIAPLNDEGITPLDPKDTAALVIVRRVLD
jgi:hypothetical protein